MFSPAAFAELLYRSSLSTEWKEWILLNLEHMSQQDAENLFSSLQNEEQMSKKTLLKLELDVNAAVQKAKTELEKLATSSQTPGVNA